MELDDMVLAGKDVGGHGPRAAAATTGVAGGGLFTSAQWVELQRQALIYKHMAASAPIPSYLLCSINSNAAAAPTSAAGSYCYYTAQLVPDYRPYGHYQAARMSMLLQCMQQAVARRRCRRTDGKKWRCARDAEPDQKYCQRHLHRARPPARKQPPAAAAVDQAAKSSYDTTQDDKGGNKVGAGGLLDFTARRTASTSVVGLPEQRENRLSLNYDTIAEHYHQLYCSSGVNKQVVTTATPPSTVMGDAIDHGSWVGIGGPLGEVLGLGYAAEMQWPGGCIREQ